MFDSHFIFINASGGGGVNVNQYFKYLIFIFYHDIISRIVCFSVCEKGGGGFRDKANSLISQEHYFPIQAPSSTSTQAVLYG